MDSRHQKSKVEVSQSPVIRHPTGRPAHRYDGLAVFYWMRKVSEFVVGRMTNRTKIRIFF
jgi:hypothetical protein